MRILLAEDEKELANALVMILQHNNYSVDVVYSGEDALDYALTTDYDAVILDIMMPKKSGLEVLCALRGQNLSVPVLMLTAKSQIDDRVAGLDAGADDYLSKPFAMNELLARLRAITRRKGDFQANTLRCGNIQLDRVSFELIGEQSSYRLSSKEFQMMEILMANPKRLISTEQFMEKVWGYDSETEMSVVWVYMSHLRKKLAHLKANVEIKATRGVGYSLEERV